MSDLMEDSELEILDIETDVLLDESNLKRHQFFYEKMKIEHIGTLKKKRKYIHGLSDHLVGLKETHKKIEDHNEKPIIKAQMDYEFLLHEQEKAKELKEDTIKNLSNKVKQKKEILKKLRGYKK